MHVCNFPRVNGFLHQIYRASYNHIGLEVICPSLKVHLFCQLFHTNVTKHTRRHLHLHSEETVLGSMQDVKGVPFAWTWLFHDGTAASIDLILIRYQFQPTTSSQQNRIFLLPVSCLEPQILSAHTPSALLSRNCLPRSFL